MRRKDKEQTKEFALSVIKNCEYATLSTIKNDNTPYAIPISVALVNETIYFHCALDGLKLDNIAMNSNVCISAVTNTKILAERFTMQYDSAVAFGKCSIVQDTEEKVLALKELSLKYSGEYMDSFPKEMKSAFEKTCVCKIKINAITGKASR